jgi:hypothetical protein
MNHWDKVKAIQEIRPDAEFSLVDDELIWLDAEQTKPTDNEIEAGFVAYQTRLANEAADAESKKLVAEAKLAALGLTAEDLKVLGLG